MMDQSSGSWTPALAGTEQPGVHEYEVQAGHWVRHGNLLTIWFNLVLARFDVTATGDVIITGDGLPFSAADFPGIAASVVFSRISDVAHRPGYSQLLGAIHPGAKHIDLFEVGDRVPMANVPVTSMTDTTALVGQVTYPLR